MEKIPKESLEQIMKEIEASTEKKALELMNGEDGEKIKSVIERKTKESIGMLPKIDESTDASSNTISEDFGKKLMEIMGEGDKEFQKKTGRRMTYGEMREMFG
jgi:DNA anti-recombination protein RmuC